MEEPLPQPPSSEPLTKKRPRENDAVSLNFKLRVILRALRPHFIEVLQTATADFRKCKAADEIRHQMEILVELFDQKTTPEDQTSATEISTEGVDKAKGTYIIGGSAFGWNFVTFTGNDPVYCGVTKETFRANNVTSVATPSQSH